jgi:hypothetical protein
MNSSNQITISKKDAVFRLDKNGRWHNQAGEFKHKKIIDYFHASIRKDKNGYHLFQSHGDHTEKVYFNYEDTALFVFDTITEDPDIFLVLNTRQKIKLQPRNLFIKDDQLYMEAGDDRIKFSERALTQISRYIDCEEDQYVLKVSEGKFLIRTFPCSNYSGEDPPVSG